MNYRHVYHAGNFADVLKHLVLALCLDHLKAKEKGFMVLDAHAGTGLYDLTSVPSEKTGEWQDGIGRLWNASPIPGTEPYMDVVHALNPDGLLRYYPGSPVVAAQLLRPQDRLVLTELHPEDCDLLGIRFRSDPRVTVQKTDAYQGLKAHLPPSERRGLALVDPPFEERDEFQRMIKGLGRALERWPTGTYLLWYPIKSATVVERALADLVNLAPPPTLSIQMRVRAEDGIKLAGNGLAVINPPWKLASQLTDILPPLTALLGDQGGSWDVRWLVEEIVK